MRFRSDFEAADDWVRWRLAAVRYILLVQGFLPKIHAPDAHLDVAGVITLRSLPLIGERLRGGDDKQQERRSAEGLQTHQRPGPGHRGVIDCAAGYYSAKLPAKGTVRSGKGRGPRGPSRPPSESVEQRQIDRVAHRAVAEIARVQVVAAVVDRQHPR